MKIPGIKGWEAKFIVEDDGSSEDTVEAYLIAIRTNTGKWTEEDQWMVEHGNEYLTRVLTSAYKSLGLPE